jgi:hypothetical protein
MYRELNCPDQAGRWGIAREGWTTPVEQDRLGRFLAPFGTIRTNVTQFLNLPLSVDQYPDLQKVIDGPVAGYVAEHERRENQSPWAERFVIASAISWVIVVILWLLAMMAVFAVALFDLTNASRFARGAGAIVSASIAIAFLATLLWSIVERRAVAAIIGTVGCAGCIVLALSQLAPR